MTGKNHCAWYLCGFTLHSLVVRDIEVYGIICYFYIIFGKSMFMSLCFPIAFLISIVKCTQQNLPLILFVCGVPVCVCICSATDVEVWRQPWIWVFTFCLVEGSISRCSLQAPGFNFWEFSYLHLSSLWRDTGIIDMCYCIQLLRGFWGSKLRLACKFFF